MAKVDNIGIKKISYLSARGYAILPSMNSMDGISGIRFHPEHDTPLAAIDNATLLSYKNGFNDFKHFPKLDPVVQYALIAAKGLVESGHSFREDTPVCIGTSRGNGTLLDMYHEDFLKKGKGGVNILASPTTTIGNIAGFVSQYLKVKGNTSVISNTCSSSLQSIIQGCLWVQAGISSEFICGGSEAPLTPFTIAQMKALKIHSLDTEKSPCRPMDQTNSSNGMVLGEGSCLMILGKCDSQSLMRIVSWGQAMDSRETATGISENGEAFYQAMKIALNDGGVEKPDLIITHCPGTIRGDKAELSAINRLFNENHPPLYNNKWIMGHTLGASGAFSLADAASFFFFQKIPSIPYLGQQERQCKLNNILINTTGFGGNTLSILVSKI